MNPTEQNDTERIRRCQPAKYADGAARWCSCSSQALSDANISCPGCGSLKPVEAVENFGKVLARRRGEDRRACGLSTLRRQRWLRCRGLPDGSALFRASHRQPGNYNPETTQNSNRIADKICVCLLDPNWTHFLGQSEKDHPFRREPPAQIFPNRGRLFQNRLLRTICKLPETLSRRSPNRRALLWLRFSARPCGL